MLRFNSPSLNYLMLAKTYLKLKKDKEKAIAYLKKAAEVTPLDQFDRQVRNLVTHLKIIHMQSIIFLPM